MELLDTLVAGVRSACASFPDARRGDVRYSMADIGMSAFSLFFMQSESFLAHQRSLEEGRTTSNCRTLFGMAAVPTDNHIRAMLDPVHPAHLQPVFDQVLDVLGRQGGLAPFARLGGRVLVALDGTEYFCSQKLGCPGCLTRHRANGRVESYHSMLAATIVAPGHAMALPLMPEFIAPQDGAEKQDCERNAAKRWLSTHGGRLKDLRPVYLGDDLFACQPVAEAIRAAGGDFLLTAKPSSHKALYDFMQGATRRADRHPESRWQAPDPPLPLVHGRAAARRTRCHAGQLGRRHRHRCPRQNHIQQRLRDLAARNTRDRRRDRGLRQGTLENRERKLQRPQVQRLLRIPMKPPGYTDLKPPGVPISKRPPFQSQTARDGVVS